MQARYYDPVIGRFLSNDPVGFVESGLNPQMFNRYSYALNNPVNLVDPDGNSPIKAGVTAFKVAKKSLKHKGNPIKGAADELASIGDDLSTFADGQLDFSDIGAAADLLLGTDLNNPKTKTANRSRRLKPDSRAKGDHTTFKTDKEGNITRHETFETNPKNPSGFDSKQSTDVTGPAHFNKKTGESVPTPHTQGRGIEGGVRPATPDEIPGKN